MHLTEEDQILHFYGESEKHSREHLLECGGCREQMEEMTKFLRGLAGAEVPEPEAGWEEAMWARIEPGLASRSRFRWQRWAPIAAAIIVTFLAGVFVRDLVGPVSDEASPAAFRTDAEGRDRVFVLVVSDHFDRAERVLLELKNVETGGLDDEQLANAEDLLETNRMYRLSAQRKGDERIERLLDELEPVFLELARSEDGGSIQSLKERVDDQALLFRVRVVTSQLRNETSSTPTPSTSI